MKIRAHWLTLAWLGVAGTLAGWCAEPSAPAVEQVTLTGRVICLPEEMHGRFGVDLPNDHAHLFGFKTTEGEYYTLLRTKMSDALFADARLREKDLVVKGRVFPGTRVLEVTGRLRSLKDGELHELYYYCDVCVINTIAPDPCLCCQAPVELVEEPVSVSEP